MSGAYWDAVVRNVVDDLSTAGPGARNAQLNAASFALGRCAHLPGADIDAALLQLTQAGEQIGLAAPEIRATMASGFRRGTDNPRDIEDGSMPFEPPAIERLMRRLAKAKLIEADVEDVQTKIDRAQAKLKSCVTITPDTAQACRPALLYLNGRGISARALDGQAAFSPNVASGPALVFPARDADGQVTGLQAVLVDADGERREHKGVRKFSHGRIAGSTFQIGPDDAADVILTEGPEDALSAHMAAPTARVVCTFGKAGLRSYTPPRGASVTILADPDLDVSTVVDAIGGGGTAFRVVRFDRLDENCTDANEYLQTHGVEALATAIVGADTADDVRAAEAEAKYDWPTPWKFTLDVPPRRWLYGDHLVRGYVSVLASAGGVGKTSMQIVEALSLATGRDLLGEPVHEGPTNVWLVNLEDPMEELTRRIAAACRYYGIKREEIDGRLFVDAGRDLRMTFARSGRDGVTTDGAMTDYMISKISENEIGAVSIDPWVAALGINENDNAEMNLAVGAVRSVADATDCAISLVHHIRKANGDQAGADHIRGASSLLGAARAARAINKITQEQAIAELGVPEDQSLGLFRVDNAKANLTLPPDKAVYRRMVGVQMPSGEYVGVCTAFSPPDLFDGITAGDTLRVQRLIHKAAQEDVPYRKSSRATQWVGHAVSQAIDADVAPAKVRALLKSWLASGVLAEEPYKDARSGRETTIIVVGEWVTRDEAGL